MPNEFQALTNKVIELQKEIAALAAAQGKRVRLPDWGNGQLTVGVATLPLAATPIQPISPGQPLQTNRIAEVETRTKLVLKNWRSPGDVLVMTAAIAALHEQHPGKYLTAVDTSCNAIFENNPNVSQFLPGEGKVIDMHYPLINEWQKRPSHFLEGYVEYLGQQLNVKLTLTSQKPFLYLSDDEKKWISQVEEITKKKTKFWLLNAGYKACFTTKNWGRQNYQEVVDRLRGKVLFVQVGKAEQTHTHPILDGTINLLGKTDDRQLIRLAYHAEGGIGPVTLLGHLCAAWEKPYINLVGGREPVAWVQYPKQQTMHTIGMLSCCRSGACDKTRTVPLGDKDDSQKTFCEQPLVLAGNDAVPRCMAMISPRRVAEIIEGTLYDA